MIDASRGILFPARLPDFERLPAPATVAPWVTWFWLSDWNIAPGRVSRQHVIAYPASNLVVERDLVGLAGPTTRASYRDLTGEGWGVGALLKPAAVPLFTEDPASERDGYRSLDLPHLHAAVHREMAVPDAPLAERRAAAVQAFASWFVDYAPALTEESLLANRAAELIDTDAEIRRPEDAAGRLGVSTRTLQRLTARHVGLSPAAMIRRRRLQEAAAQVRRAPDADLSEIAAELGYADHAHLTTDFRRVLGFTPSRYRREAAGENDGPPVRKP